MIEQNIFLQDARKRIEYKKQKKSHINGSETNQVQIKYETIQRVKKQLHYEQLFFFDIMKEFIYIQDMRFMQKLIRININKQQRMQMTKQFVKKVNTLHNKLKKLINLIKTSETGGQSKDSSETKQLKNILFSLSKLNIHTWQENINCIAEKYKQVFKNNSSLQKYQFIRANHFDYLPKIEFLKIQLWQQECLQVLHVSVAKGKICKCF